MVKHVDVAEPILGDEERSNLSDVLDSGRFLQGEFVEEFEEKWADYVGTKHAVAVTNGTTAIQLSLKALGLEPGDEVIVPSLTFGSTATAVVHQAGVPVFADIDREIYTLDHTDLERCVSDETFAIMPVHLYGHPAEMDKIRAFADEHDLYVIEDAAQAHGASYKDDFVGSIGDVACFSFYATKNITTGEGGIVTTDNDAVAEQLRMLRSHGMANRDQHVTLGYNFRMSELNGAIGTAQVDRLERFNKRRRDISERLLNELNDLDWLEPATVRTYVNHAYFWAPFEVKPEKIGMSGKEVWRKLRDRGVETRHRYNIPLYDQPVFERHRGFNSDFPWSENANNHDYDLSLPNVEAIVGNMIGLPNHPNLTEEEIQYVIETVRDFEDAV
ncbi:DegT/DnrJ/EryC1/StrS family aminotransferase [Halorubrum sp. Atlit-8R]|uniref:DegT/DnrJ/EryC1/StrS family aminotransferase n=1 Tax=unclassified Halorubrum TaxID=2642239 RepID=UPI000EF23807|nr:MULTISPECIES: DegT/DnrJ/EryC1/StrS family aminotransferase [unclassified Halorubrum]RLM70770.1 DegT/DnrJ/EryC1/StrS family aminotransferase [Halorubrum sp. Atlit-9R]RLM71638.1 DegT/DnrJ/EryC1/StrS family aminotransferase [Halorubrum sp. Atlit-9R]RLM83077.1 DegT/DnrJ/EryC1/StrS family aminotransferase [Halorubrum sp. Atlit-8R]